MQNLTADEMKRMGFTVKKCKFTVQYRFWVSEQPYGTDNKYTRVFGVLECDVFADSTTEAIVLAEQAMKPTLSDKNYHGTGEWHVRGLGYSGQGYNEFDSSRKAKGFDPIS